MQKTVIALTMCNMLVATGCPSSTYIADERLEDTEAVLDTLPDSEIDQVDCEGLSATPGDTDRTIQVGGDMRSYVLHIPDSYTGLTPSPLLFDFHMSNGSGPNQLSNSIYPPVTDSEGVVMAFPSGLSDSRGTAWNIGPCCVEDVDDVAFTRAMIADIEAIAFIDSSRIYAAGTYTGGGMAYYLACHAADVFAAVASSAFDLNEETVEDCMPVRPISVVSFRTTEDPVMPYDGGPGDLYPDSPLTFLGAVGTFEKWAEINGCTGMASDDGNGCQRYTASQCEGEAEVMLCTEQGVPGDAAIAWPVLKRHSLP